MVKGLYTAYTGMINQMKRLDTMTNNLANSDTNGYKSEFATSQSFDDVLAFKVKDQSESLRGYNMHYEGDITLGVKIGEVYTDFSQGSFKETGNDYDVALGGNGFFAISFTNNAGEQSFKLTRDGAFVVDDEGYLRTKDGDYVLNQQAALAGNATAAGYIQIDPNLPATIDRAGTIWQNEQIVGTLGFVDVDNYDTIEKYGENMYQIVEGGNIIASGANVYQGYLEMSNTQVVNNMVDMIAIYRAYESNQRVETAMDDMIDKAVNQVGRVS